MVRDEEPGRSRPPRRLSPLTIIVVLVTLAVTWFILSSEDRRRQQQQQEQQQRLGELSLVPETSELVPEKYTAAFTSTIVPLSSSGPRFYLYVSPSTTRYFASLDVNYDSYLQHWRLFFKERRFSVNTVSDLSAIPQEPAPVLVLPSALALSNAEKQGLANFQRQGGSILATWAPGSRNRNGEFDGYGFVEQLFGVKVSGEIARSSREEFLSLSGDTPITSGYPAGRRIWIESRPEKWLRLAGGSQAGFYTDWLRITAPGGGAAAVTYGEHDAARRHARWVMLGFSETSWGTQARELYGLLENSLHWLARGVTVTRKTWPIPYRAAYVIEMDTEEGFKNAQHLARMMDDIVGAPATFYSITSEAERHPELVRDLARRHEIAFHGDVHTSFRRQPEVVQAERLDRMQKDMAKILGGPVPLPGFRPPREEYDTTTERLLHAKGFGHHAVDPDRTDAILPFIYPGGKSRQEGSLVIIPRAQRDDFNLPIARQGNEAEKALQDALTADFDLAVQLGALGFLSIHSQHFGQDSLLNAVMPAFLRHVARHKEQVWVTSSNRIAHWWRERERLEYGITGSSGKFVINVTVHGRQPLETAVFIVANARANVPARVRAVGSGDVRVAVNPMDDLRSAIVLDGIPPGRYEFEVLSLPEPA